MESTLRDNHQPFIAAFVSSTLDPHLQHAFLAEYNHHYFITDIKLVSSKAVQQKQEWQLYELDENYCLVISRNPCKLPIIDVVNFQQVPQGWEPITSDFQFSQEFKSVPCFKRGSLIENGKCLDSFQIFDSCQEEKDDFINEVTQPSLTYKSEQINNCLRLSTKNLQKIISFSKKSSIQLSSLRFKAKTQSLYQSLKDEIYIPNLDIMCFPDGVKLSKKQSGFKFFSFILTNDSAQRFYCNALTFYERCSNEIQTNILQKYGVISQKGLFCQKVLVVISHYSCTDHTKKCLQYLYRIYLSNPIQKFKEKLSQICQNFTINSCTKYTRLRTQDFNLGFKINTSYPQTSNQAIYAVFKFLQVQNIVTIVQSLLLQRKVFFISKCQNIIGMAIQAFLSFLYPLNWIHAIINPLSMPIIQYKDAPLTIIFGLSTQLAYKLQQNTDCLLVYLDKNQVQMKKGSEKNLSFSFNLRKQLITRLKQFSVYDEIDIRDYLNNPENLSLFKTQQTEDPDFDPYKIRNIFFELTVFMLRNYNQYFRIKEEGNNSANNQRVRGFKSYYNLNGLIQLNKKDQFMCAFYKTSLFSVLVQKKYQQPNNKWIKTLDKAIRKIASYSKQFIQEESDNLSDTNQPEKKQRQIIPKGCLNMISMISRSDEEQTDKSSPSPKKSRKNKMSTQKQSEFQDQKHENSINQPRNLTQGRMSLPNQYEKRHNSLLEGNKQFLKKSSNEEKRRKSTLSNDNVIDADTQKQEKETDKGSQSCGKSQSDIPQLKQNAQVIVYQFDVEKQEPPGFAYLICSFLSKPIKRVSESVVNRWTKKGQNKLKFWKNKKDKKQQKAEVVEMAQERREPKQQQKCKNQ